ncbi:MAG: Mur ligase domain-containing protein [Bacillota bacterium]|nr:Mur ligase domain-containing protein [Bacillota bacterium]
MKVKSIQAFQASDSARLRDLPSDSLIYFVGIGGISMSGLAELSRANGYRVIGSDMQASDHTKHLQKIGISVIIGQTGDNIDTAMPDLVVYSAAVPKNNPERMRAEERGILAVERGDFLGWLTRDFDRVINVAGTHGKTTTTAMTALLLLASELEPTVHLGALLEDFNNSTVHMGRPGQLLVSEACEFRDSFIHFTSTTALVLNIDSDHLDYFGTIDNVIHAFARFADHLPASGHLIVPWHGRYVGRMLSELEDLRLSSGLPMPNLVSFAIDGHAPEAIPAYAGEGARQKEHEIQAEEADDVLFAWPPEATIEARNVVWYEGLPGFDLYWHGECLGHIRLGVPGHHNIYNALAAMAAALLNGADPANFDRVLTAYRGAEGRFTIKGYFQGAKVVTDYAHHPTAVSATLGATVNYPHKRLFVIFQPLTFNRVQLLFDDFVASLEHCDPLQLIEIYSDRESDDLGMSSRLLVDAINARGGKAVFSLNYDEVKLRLKDAGPGDLILFLGPEDVRSYGDRLVSEPEGCKQEFVRD